MTGYLLTSGENNHIYTNPKADRTKTTNDATVRVKNPANAEPCGNFSSKNFSDFSVCKTGNQNLMCEQDSIASQEKCGKGELDARENKNNITGCKIIIGSNRAQSSAVALGDASLSGKGDHSSVIDRFYLPGNVNGNYVLFRLDQCN